jgi:hypothetical protein
VIGFVAVVSALVAGLFWLTPSITWPVTRLNWWEFLQLREDIASVAAIFATFCVPVAISLGFAVGAPAGVVVRMIRRGSRLGVALAVCLVLISVWRTATTTVVSAATELAIEWHRSTGIHRLGFVHGSYITAVLAAFYGAVAGGLVAGVAASHQKRDVRDQKGQQVVTIRESVQATVPPSGGAPNDGLKRIAAGSFWPLQAVGFFKDFTRVLSR